MPNYTSNYKLTKPLASDLYNIDHQNNNMDVIDTNLKAASNKANEADTRSKTNASNLEALKSFQEDPFEETGSLVQVDLFQDAPLNVVSKIEPVQPGSGAPYPAGCGKNLLEVTAKNTTWNGITFTINDNGSVTANGTATDLSYLNNSVRLPAGNYFVNGCPSGGNITSGYFVRIVVNDQNVGDDIGNGFSFTLTEESEVVVRIAIRRDCKVETLTFNIMVTLASETDKTYAPYANIRPISGRTSAKLTRCGKNLLPLPYKDGHSKNENGVTYTVYDDGSVSAKGVPVAYSSFALYDGNVFPGDVIMTIGDDVSGIVVNVQSYSSDGELVFNKRSAVPSDPILIDYTNHPSVVRTVIVAVRQNNNTEVSGVMRPMIRLASESDATYEPYQRETFTVDFGQTVYGGEIDWGKGLLTVDGKMVTLTGGESWAWFESRDFLYLNGLQSAFEPWPNDLVCSHYKVPIYEAQENPYVTIVSTGTYNDQLRFYHTGYTDVAAWKAYLAEQYAAGTPVQIAYKLAEPTTIQLTAHELSALAGLNSLYSDCGDTTVSGRKDIIWLTHSLIKRIEALEAQVAGL